jgi:hypothetical protein
MVAVAQLASCVVPHKPQVGPALEQLALAEAEVAEAAAARLRHITAPGSTATSGTGAAPRGNMGHATRRGSGGMSLVFDLRKLGSRGQTG